MGFVKKIWERRLSGHKKIAHVIWNLDRLTWSLPLGLCKTTYFWNGVALGMCSGVRCARQISPTERFISINSRFKNDFTKHLLGIFIVIISTKNFRYNLNWFERFRELKQMWTAEVRNLLWKENLIFNLLYWRILCCVGYIAINISWCREPRSQLQHRLCSARLICLAMSIL